MPRRKKRFDCGHSGFGRFCRPCEAKRRARVERLQAKESRRKTLSVSPIQVDGFPGVVQDKAMEVMDAMMSGVHWGALGGKQICGRGGDDLISVPLGRRYRILFEAPREGRPPRPIRVLSHEDYNDAVKRR